MHPLAQLDHRHVWHPFTQMRDWLKTAPITIVSGKGAVLRDAEGKSYLDANASIWTNLHGHRHPRINASIRAQLSKIAHSSALGLANEPASILAGELVRLANEGGAGRPALEKVFFSDDGSTAMEAALKLAYEVSRRERRLDNPRFLSLEGAYHGDTIGAVSLGHIDLFHARFRGMLFETDAVMAPYCYRCPFNRAAPERRDAREYRSCEWQCVSRVGEKLESSARAGRPYAGFVVEPLIQGAAGMIAQPAGWLRRVASLAREHGVPLIADEVMTAFGRAGEGGLLLASHVEGVQPDYAAVAKGLTGGYLPMAATLTTRRVFEAFLGEYSEFKTFFHGHSYTGNQLGAAAALASLGLLQGEASLRDRRRLEGDLRRELAGLWDLPRVGDIRQAGTMAGIELTRNWRDRSGYALEERAGIRVCERMARHGVLTRPIGNVVVLMPPFCTTTRQVKKIVKVLGESVAEVLE